MPVIARMIPSPVSVIVEHGALDGLPDILSDHRISTTGQVAIVVSAGSGEALRARFSPLLPDADWYTVADGTMASAVRLSSELKGGRYDAVVALGGGKVIDAAKYAAGRIGLPTVACATNLAHDGICSPVSILDDESGRQSVGVSCPIVAVVDLDVVREAPSRFVASGVGEVLSNLSAVADWELSHVQTGEVTDGLATAMARSAGLVMLRHTGGIHQSGFAAQLAESLVISGIAMNIAGSTRPSSGACHEISHAFDILYPTRRAPHGEQVGLGAAFASYLRGDKELAGELAHTLRRHGLPATAAQIHFSAEEFARAAHYAPQTRPGRFTILEHVNLSEADLRAAYEEYLAHVGL
ncbi:iron-containing alcohol dehydrogenase family protein [Streptomyces sp. AP-93]|uniref:iron-containing alcohol dehydrogenase family protein n=1 Tax=Streptomyces sp. AP-93 TaxID=2929048 RepID=UPI001FAEB4EF|nr:iron-containing alcohol dehydrogenase family protein [Streptomyces sp. AP-93]MCJ0875396.1 iron-containing alcohol dehydrogenase family protein [Streptomyces sp. AP-93]